MKEKTRYSIVHPEPGKTVEVRSLLKSRNFKLQADQKGKLTIPCLQVINDDGEREPLTVDILHISDSSGLMSSDMIVPANTVTVCEDGTINRKIDIVRITLGACFDQLVEELCQKNPDYEKVKNTLNYYHKNTIGNYPSMLRLDSLHGYPAVILWERQEETVIPSKAVLFQSASK